MRLSASPRTLTALPLTVTGAVTTGATWLPPAMLPEPLVVADPASGWCTGAPVAGAEAEASPSTLTASPVMVTGASTDGRI